MSIASDFPFRETVLPTDQTYVFTAPVPATPTTPAVPGASYRTTFANLFADLLGQGAVLPPIGTEIGNLVAVGADGRIDPSLYISGTGGGGVGDVLIGGTPTNGQLARWTSGNTIEGFDLPAYEPESVVITSSDAAVTLLLSHNRARLRLTNAAPVLTIPPQSSVAFPVGFAATVFAPNGGTIRAGGDLTLNGSGVDIPVGPSMDGQAAAITRDAENAWTVIYPGEVTGGTGGGVTPEQANLIENAVQASELGAEIAAIALPVNATKSALILGTPGLIGDAATNNSVYDFRDVALASNVLSFDAADGLAVAADAGGATVQISEAPWTNLQNGQTAIIWIQQGATGRDIAFVDTSNNLLLPDSWPSTFAVANAGCFFLIGWLYRAGVRSKRWATFSGFMQ